MAPTVYYLVEDKYPTWKPMLTFWQFFPLLCRSWPSTAILILIWKEKVETQLWWLHAPKIIVKHCKFWFVFLSQFFCFLYLFFSTPWIIVIYNSFQFLFLTKYTMQKICQKKVLCIKENVRRSKWKENIDRKN